jgi:hypothetical protein
MCRPDPTLSRVREDGRDALRAAQRDGVSVGGGLVQEIKTMDQPDILMMADTSFSKDQLH